MIYSIYCDGACSGNPVGPGGFGVVILKHNGPDHLCTPIPFKELNGGPFDKTSNNQMEMTAVIEGLKVLEIGSRVITYTDSKYVIKGAIREHQRKKNLDLWELLDKELAIREVKFQWVRGHSGHVHNERADKLARFGVKGKLI